MAFWSNAQSEAKRNYRFKVTINQFDGYQGDGGTTSVWWAKTATLPSYDVSEVEHNHMDNKYYFPGRVTWSEVELTMVDPITPNAVERTNAMLVNSGYQIPATHTAAKTFVTKAKSAAAGVISFKIQILNGEGIKIEEWDLKNPFIKAAKFGDLAYDNDDLREITLTLRYDWATHTGTSAQFTKTT